MEEDHQSPPCDHVEAVGQISDPTVLLSVVLAGGVHPVLHLIEGVAGLVVAPVAVDQPTEAHSHRSEVVLEAGVVAPRSGVLVDDDTGPVHVQPDVRLPGVCCVVHADQRANLLLEAQRVSADPVRQADHAGLVELVVVRTGSDVDPHGPHLRVLGIATLVDLRVGVTVRGPSTSGPVHPGHVEIDVVRDRDFRMVLLDVVLGPVVRAALAALLARPQAEHHRTAGFEVRQRARGLEDHGCPGCVVVCSNAGPVGAGAGGVRVKQHQIRRWRDVEVRAEDEPIVWGLCAPLVRADVVRLRVLDTENIRELEAMRHHLEAERLQLADQVLRRILVSRVALPRPAVPVACAPIDVHCKARVGDLVEPVVHDSSVQQAAGVGPALVHASNRGANRAHRLHRYAPTALGAVVHCVQSRILIMRHSYDPVARIALVPFMHHPGHPRLV